MANQNGHRGGIDPLKQAADEQRRRVTAAVTTQLTPLRRSFGMLAVFASEARDGWNGAADEMRDMATVAEDDRQARTLRRMSRNARQMSRLAASISRDADRLLSDNRGG